MRKLFASTGAIWGSLISLESAENDYHKNIGGYNNERFNFNQ